MPLTYVYIALDCLPGVGFSHDGVTHFGFCGRHRGQSCVYILESGQVRTEVQKMEVGWGVSKCLDGKTFTVTGLRVRGSGLPKVWTRSSSSPGRTARRLDDLSRKLTKPERHCGASQAFGLNLRCPSHAAGLLIGAYP